ncbi:hypothetical protein GE21DRAFT_1131969 [Neurospora crassa]|nr:hypothetical protein GE21DRAFT_1131969 [Neurospora crassa]
MERIDGGQTRLSLACRKGWMGEETRVIDRTKGGRKKTDPRMEEGNEKKKKKKKKVSRRREKACACDDKKKQAGESKRGRSARKRSTEDGRRNEGASRQSSQVDGRAEREKKPTAKGNLGSVFMRWVGIATYRCTVTCGRVVGT